MSDSWWVESDMPVRAGCRVYPLIDGRAAMLAMCRAFLSAKSYILLAGWDIRADLQMVRGEDAQGGPRDRSGAGLPGSPEQEALLADLRDDGLDEGAIALWAAGRLRVMDVLGYAASHGVHVGVLLWDAYHFGNQLTNDPQEERAQLVSVGVDCLLDDSSRRITHIAQSLHQKCAVVDGRIAFLGGVDLTAQATGDYDRWDTHTHPCASPVRVGLDAQPVHPWHDVHTRLEGPIVADVQRNIAQRWAEVAARHNVPNWPSQLPQAAPAPLTAGMPSQIVRTIPAQTYDFAPDGIATILDAYLRALRQAHTYVYLENQYLWPEIFVGLDSTRWGERSPQAQQLLDAMAAALDRSVRLALVLPDHPNTGRRFTDGGVAWLRSHLARPANTDLLDVYTLGSSDQDDMRPGGIFYRPVYVHAKVAIVDDEWWMAGSANLNSRGLHSDAEINVVTLDTIGARGLRRRLWAEHTHLPFEDVDDLADPLEGLARLRSQAARNLERLRAGQPLEGHLLPYIAYDDAARLGVHVHPEHGVLDALPGGTGAYRPEHADRYV